MRTYSADDVKKLTSEFVKLADPNKLSSRRAVMQEILKRHSSEGDAYKSLDLDSLAYLFNQRVVKRLNAGKSVPGAHPEFLNKWVGIMQPKSNGATAAKAPPAAPTTSDAPVAPVGKVVTSDSPEEPIQLSSKLQKFVGDCMNWKQRALTAEATVREFQNVMAKLEEEGVLTGV